ncbi:MAG: phosphatase PAP2 family protein [Nitrospira sp.]|nr:phosphatase PAP2 family protein [bacterium]MBL7049152.1 phosphatase PAP2 family protein [Nitrospira sp.]
MLCAGGRVYADDFNEKAGDVLLALIPSTVIAATYYIDDTQGRAQFYKSLLASAAAAGGLKYTINRTRPDGGSRSFPSGHSTISFQGAAFVHKRYGFQRALPAYLGAAFVGYSRVQSDRHYLEDVLAGAALGIASSYFFTAAYENSAVTVAYNEGMPSFVFWKEW